MALIDKEQIRAEIERRKDNYDKMLHEWSIAEVRGRREEDKELLSILDTIPEQPVEMDNEEKIRNFFDAIGDCGFSQYDILRLKSIWGDMGYSIPKQEQPVEGLEEAARHSEILTYPMPEDGDIEKVIKVQEARILHEIGFKAGAEWQKAKMLEGAVEGYVCKNDRVAEAPFYYVESVCYDVGDLMLGDKVRVIVIKEDEK